MSRKMFNHDDLTQSVVLENNKKAILFENSISACGCLFYKLVDGNLQLLLISYSDPGWPKLDDLGGKIDLTDSNVFEAIARETSEETNGVISKGFVLNLLNNNFDSVSTFYNKQSKYYMVLHEVDNNFYPDTSVFGNFEFTDKISRTIHWFDYAKIKHKMAIRLLGNVNLINYFESLNGTKAVSQL